MRLKSECWSWYGRLLTTMLISESDFKGKSGSCDLKLKEQFTQNNTSSPPPWWWRSSSSSQNISGASTWNRFAFLGPKFGLWSINPELFLTFLFYDFLVFRLWVLLQNQNSGSSFLSIFYSVSINILLIIFKGAICF